MNPTDKRGLRPVHLNARSAAKVTMLSVQPDDVLIVSANVADQLVRADSSFKLVDDVPAPTPTPAAVCEHGKVRSWTGVSVPGDDLPAIEECDVCDADSTPLEVDPAKPAADGRRPRRGK